MREKYACGRIYNKVKQNISIQSRQNFKCDSNVCCVLLHFTSQWHTRTHSEQRKFGKFTTMLSNMYTNGRCGWLSTRRFRSIRLNIATFQSITFLPMSVCLSIALLIHSSSPTLSTNPYDICLLSYHRTVHLILIQFHSTSILFHCFCASHFIDLFLFRITSKLDDPTCKFILHFSFSLFWNFVQKL